MDPQGIVPKGVEDAHKRIQYHQEGYEERNERNQNHISLVTWIGCVPKHALGGSGRNLQIGVSYSQRKSYAKRSCPGNCDQSLSPVGVQLILPLDYNKESINANDEQDGYSLYHKQPEKHSRYPTEELPKNPPGRKNSHQGKGHVQHCKQHVCKCQAGKEDVNGRTHGSFLVNHEANNQVPKKRHKQYKYHYSRKDDLERQV